MSFLVAAASSGSSINLQATLSAGSSAQPVPPTLPHHPITCSSKLSLHEDGTFECEHAAAPAGDTRTRVCVDHSISVLLIELLRERESRVPPPG